MIWTFYKYKATTISIVDGDTCIGMVDKGFFDYSQMYIRLHGINTPELNSTDLEVRKKAVAAKEFLESILPIGSVFWIDSKKLDPYKRPIAEIYLPGSAISINQQMINSGFAVKY